MVRRRKRSVDDRGRVDLSTVIREKYPVLPGNQRKAADFLLAHMREAPFLSIVDLEQQSGASKAKRCVVRLAISLFLSAVRNQGSPVDPVSS